MTTIELIEDAALFGGTVPNERIDEVRNFINELKSEALNIQSVSHSKVFEAYGKPFTSGRDLWNWLNDNCEIRLKT